MVMLLPTKPSARSTFSATSFFASIGAPLPDFARPASITVAFGEAPEPSICRLQRMQRPSFGMPCGSGRPVGDEGGSGLPVSARPSTATRLCALGQCDWYLYETAPEPWSDFSRYLSHCFGKAGTFRTVGSV